MTNDPHVVIRVDIGGTKVAAGLVNVEGVILPLNKISILTTGESSNGLAAVPTAIRGLLADASSQNQIAGSWRLLEMKPVDFTYE